MLEHKCEICGRLSRKKLYSDGKVVCNKHYKQFHRHGCFTDQSPRIQTDKNEIHIQGNIAYIDLYDKHYNVVAQAIIDADDVELVKNIKWRMNCNGYAINNTKVNTFLHRKVLNSTSIVDHINGNRLDNRKCNLREVTQSQNQMNVNYLGVYQHGDRWLAKIKKNQKQIHIGLFDYREEALYARWYAERQLFGEYAYQKPEPCILTSRKQEIQDLVNRKVQRL